jgi:hypothetical protein
MSRDGDFDGAFDRAFPLPSLSTANALWLPDNNDNVRGVSSAVGLGNNVSSSSNNRRQWVHAILERVLDVTAETAHLWTHDMEIDMAIDRIVHHNDDDDSRGEDSSSEGSA